MSEQPIIKATSVELKAIEWLWRGRVPKDTVTALGGEGGLGKTTLMHHLAAAITTGQPLAGQPTIDEPGNVLLVSNEDDLGSIVVPRLKAIGADCDRVFLWTFDTCTPNLDPDSNDSTVDAIEEIIKDNAIRLVILDPITALLGDRVNSHKEADVQRVLSHLRTICAAQRCATVGLIHLNKGNGGSANGRVTGSSAWINCPRSVLLVTNHPDAERSKNKRTLANSKNNCGRQARTLTFTIGESAHKLSDTHTLTVSTIKSWDGEIDAEADDLLAPPKSPHGESALDAAVEWLEDLLDGNDPLAPFGKSTSEPGIPKTAWLSQISLNISIQQLRQARRGPKGGA
jgi:predicted ATP-dependent serine protease